MVGVSVIDFAYNELSAFASDLLRACKAREKPMTGASTGSVAYCRASTPSVPAADRLLSSTRLDLTWMLQLTIHQPRAIPLFRLRYEVETKLQSIDIKYRGTEGHTVSGVVTGAISEAMAAGQVDIELFPRDRTSVLSLAFVSAAEPRRSFSFEALADGEIRSFRQLSSMG